MPEGGWWGVEGPPEEAYSRVTNAERFRPLHGAMREIIRRLESDFEVEREDGFGLDADLEKRLELAGPSVRLTPRNAGAAPIAVVFTTFPGLRLRFGRWYEEPFPDCGCDACDESAAGEIERLNEMVEDVIAGRFRETLRRPLISFMGSSWLETRFWSPDGFRSRSGSRVWREDAERMSGGRRRLVLDWKSWILDC